MTETITFERLSSDGDAVGRLSTGKTVFVPYACPGEVAEITVDEEQERWARGHIISIQEPSPARIEPVCPVFGLAGCGGCQWQHLSYETTLEAKRQQVVDACTRIGKIAEADELCSATLASPQTMGYRNKIELEVRLINKRLTLGFHQSGGTVLVTPEGCPLFASRHPELIKALQGALRYANGDADYELSRVALRSNTAGELEIALFTDPGVFPRKRFASTLQSAFPEAVSSVRVVQTPPVHTGREHRPPVFKSVEVLAGAGHLEERLGAFTYKVSAPSFFQVNTAAATRLVECVLEGLAVDGSDTVVDLYCGVGTFSLPLATRANKLIALESFGPAVRDLRRNVSDARLNVEVIGGDAGLETRSISYADALVVDPPRAGLSPRARNEILRIAPARMAYVSCNPATLARDLRTILDGGYRLQSLKPFDLFPQTAHVECLALLKKGAVNDGTCTPLSHINAC